MRYCSLRCQVAKMQNIVVLGRLSVTNPLPVLENKALRVTNRKQSIFNGLGKK